jgi:hypothetical protein
MFQIICPFRILMQHLFIFSTNIPLFIVLFQFQFSTHLTIPLTTITIINREMINGTNIVLTKFHEQAN